MAMAKVGPRVAHLHLACVLPHFELVQHAVVENETGERFYGEQTQKGCNKDQQKVQRDFHWTGVSGPDLRRS
jgi:hypothetical protein